MFGDYRKMHSLLIGFVNAHLSWSPISRSLHPGFGYPPLIDKIIAQVLHGFRLARYPDESVAWWARDPRDRIHQPDGIMRLRRGPVDPHRLDRGFGDETLALLRTRDRHNNNRRHPLAQLFKPPPDRRQ